MFEVGSRGINVHIEVLVPASEPVCAAHIQVRKQVQAPLCARVCHGILPQTIVMSWNLYCLIIYTVWIFVPSEHFKHFALICVLVCVPKLRWELVCVPECSPNLAYGLVCDPKLVCTFMSALICAPKLVMALICATSLYPTPQTQTSLTWVPQSRLSFGHYRRVGCPRAFGHHNPISLPLCLPMRATIACGN